MEAADKVQYINYVKELPSEVARQAALSLYFHKTGTLNMLISPSHLSLSLSPQIGNEPLSLDLI